MATISTLVHIVMCAVAVLALRAEGVHAASANYTVILSSYPQVTMAKSTSGTLWGASMSGGLMCFDGFNTTAPMIFTYGETATILPSIGVAFQTARGCAAFSGDAVVYWS
jgi:hypothetical protein